MLCPIFITVCLLHTHVDFVFVARSSLTWQYAGEHVMSFGLITLTLRQPGTDCPDSTSTRDIVPSLYVNQGHITFTLRQPGTDYPDSTSTKDRLPSVLREIYAVQSGFSWYYLVNSCFSFFPFSFGHGLLYSSLSFLLPVCIFRLVLQTSVT